jgi:cystathionine beta-lyase
MNKDPPKAATWLAEAGRRKPWRGKLVSPPVERASTILFDSVAELNRGRARLGEYRYGLQGTAPHWALSEALTGLEPGAAGTALFPSGLAAISTTLLSFLKPGDRLLVTDAAYGPTRRFCDTILKTYDITTEYYDPMIGGDIADLISDNTRSILLESPGTYSMEVQDVPAICAVARERGVTTILDNSWATPLLFPALAAGVDISIVAATKYVAGHADLLLGTATATPEYFEHLQETAWDMGHAVSPDDAWLALRGFRTMGLRLRHQGESALKVARWLKAQPRVEAVLHPALPECPGHDVWERDFAGAAGLFSIMLHGGREARTRFVEGLKHFGIGFSWGGFESLAIPADPKRTTRKIAPGKLVRFSIGLEDPDDLIADLAQALAQSQS